MKYGDVEEKVMRKFLYLNLILILFLLENCGPKQDKTDERSSGYPVHMTYIDGVKTVLNPDIPRDGRIKYQMGDVITLGEEGGPEEGILYFPGKIQVDSKGNIYVFDAEDYTIKVYDDKGHWIRNIGRRGQGPGEYMNMTDFDVSLDGRIFTCDIRQRRISFLNSDGTFDSSFLMKGPCDRLELDETGQLYLQQNFVFKQTSTSGSRQWEWFIIRTDPKGKNPFEYGKFLGTKIVWRPRQTEQGLWVNSHISRDSHTTVWIVDKQERLYLGYSQDYLISVLDKKGKPLFKFGRDFTPIKHPLYSPNLAHPEYYPAFYSRHLFFDDEGNLWLKQYIESDETGHLYDVFSPDGIFIQQAEVSERIIRYQNGKVYTIVETSSGDHVAKCYKLIQYTH